jgi:FdhD protein
VTNTNTGLYPTTYISYDHGAFRPVESDMIKEGRVIILVNGQELATLMCTPYQLDELATGFLRSEGIIESLSDIDSLTISASQSCADLWLVDVWLIDRDIKLPTRRIITSGCGGGVTFDDQSRAYAPLNTSVTIEAAKVQLLVKKLYEAGELYRAVQGVHTSALSDGRELLLVAEDVGRHNTIDRLWGKAMRQTVTTRDRILLSTGRLSSEVFGKAYKMGVPILISRTSPTSLSIKLARAAKMTIIGYARGDSLRIYSTPERVVADSMAPGELETMQQTRVC